MEILRTISLYVEDKGMPFLVIGGHAVNAYGISRQTGDLDLLVQKSHRSRWLELFIKLDYQRGQDDDRFARFQPKSLAAWPIDLMFVDDKTFEKMLAQAEEHDFGVVRAKVVSPRHLVTLKLHALKHFQEHRFGKDYSDLISLLRTKKAVFFNDELKELCQRYANNELFDRIVKDLGAI